MHNALTSQNDTELVKAVQGGNIPAFDVLVTRYFGMVYMIVFARLHQRETAEDLTQEVFLRAYLHLKSLDPPYNFSVWISTIARNLSYSWLRKKQRTSRLIKMVSFEQVAERYLESSDHGGRKKMEIEEQEKVVQHAIKKLPPELSEIVLLHYSENLSKKEIAQRLGIHPSTVGRHLDQALKKMKYVLDPFLQNSFQTFRPSPKSVTRTLAIVSSVAALSVAKQSTIAAAAGGAAALSSTALMGTGAGSAAAGGVAHMLKNFIAVVGTLLGKAKAGSLAAAVIVAVTLGAYVFDTLKTASDERESQTINATVQSLQFPRDLPSHLGIGDWTWPDEDRVASYTFEPDETDWRWVSVENDLLNPTTGSIEQMSNGQRALALNSYDKVAFQFDTPSTAYGFWQSPNTTVEDRIPYIPGKLYKVVWSIVSDQPDAALQPGLRFRIATGSDACGGDMVVQEWGGYKPVISTDPNTPTKIAHYWYPPQWLVNENVTQYPKQSGLYITVDMRDNRPEATGTYWIPEVEVFMIDPPQEGRIVFEAPPFDLTPDVWSSQTKEGNVLSSIDKEDGLVVVFPSSLSNTWRQCNLDLINPRTPIPLEANTLYRLTYMVTSSGNKLPVIRERMVVRYLYLVSENILTPTAPKGSRYDYAAPGPVSRKMVCYLPVSEQYLTGDDLVFAMNVYGPLEGDDPYVGMYRVSSIKLEAIDVKQIE